MILAEEVLFEYNPSLDINRNDARSASYPEASLAWLGKVDDRPVYAGRSTQVNITPNMDSSLWSFVAAKKMDEKMFRALVCGVLEESRSPYLILFNPTAFYGNIFTIGGVVRAKRALLQHGGLQ